jgi:uncharacterized membrane protein YkvA (DUF1232 family)
VSDETAITKSANGDLYQRLRSRIDAWLATREGRTYRFADTLLLLPDLVHLLIRLALDGRVPMELKTQTAAVLAYVALPLDLVPEIFVGPTGFADDVLLVVLMIRRLLGSVPADVVSSHWAGADTLLDTVRDVMETAEEMVGNRVWSRLQRMVGRGDS